MNGHDTFEIWAPASARWSPWVKPVLFAWMRECKQSAELPELSTEWEFSWVPSPREGALLILDLPGAEGVAAGVALIERGFRPVPLYNAIPLATPFGPGNALNESPPVVEVLPIVRALDAATARLTLADLPDDAPPAFLLDSLRRTALRPPLPGYFDNRSVSFPTDFPSANFLLGHQLRRVVLVQRSAASPNSDLAHTLRAWQDAGLVIELKRVDKPGAPVTCEVPKPNYFGSLFYRALEMIGFRRNVLGGFGGVLPDPSSGG